MTVRGAALSALIVAMLAPIAAAGDASPGVAAAVRADAGRLPGISLPPDARPKIAALVAAVEREAVPGRAWSALERLREARRFAAVAATSGKSGAFEAQWSEAAPRLRADLAARRGWDRAAAAARALGEAAEGTALPLLDASRAYAKVTSDEAGRYYLADARAAADFGAFCRTLPAAEKPAPAWRSIAPELARLQEKVDAAFVPPRSIDRHSDFIRLNATLKTARELDASGSFAGAAYEYLRAIEALAVLGGSGGGADVREAIAAARSTLEASPRDESLGLLFVERAESGLSEGGDAGAASAAAIARSVLPACRALGGPPAAAPAGISSVTVTLVRWPYT